MAALCMIKLFWNLFVRQIGMLKTRSPDSKVLTNSRDEISNFLILRMFLPLVQRKHFNYPQLIVNLLIICQVIAKNLSLLILYQRQKLRVRCLYSPSARCIVSVRPSRILRSVRHILSKPLPDKSIYQGVCPSS